MRGPLIAIALLTATVPAVAQDPAGFEIRAEYLLRRHDQGALPTSMLVAMLRDPYPETRVFAVRVVAASADPSQAMLLAEYLRDRDFRVRYEVMLAAGRFGEAGRGLAFRGLRDEIPKVRQAAAWAACHTGDPALEPLVTRLAGETDIGVRATAFANLWRFDDPRWIAHAARAAVSDEPQLRRAAAYSLARTDHLNARAALRSLAADADPVIRATAVAGLRRAALARDDAMVIARAVEDPDPRVRTAACWVLAERPETELDESRATAVAGLWRSPEPQLAAMALRAAAAHPEIGDDADLLSIASSGEPWLAAEAFAAAVRRGADGAERLARRFIDGHVAWQKRAVAAVAPILGGDFETAVQGDADATVRLAWLEHLPPDAIGARLAVLRGLLDADPDPAVRAVAVRLLVDAEVITGVDELLDLAQRWRPDGEPFARAEALSLAVAVAANEDEIDRVLERARADTAPVVAVRVRNAARELGIEVPPTEREPRHNRQWYAELVEWMLQPHWLDVETDRGTFRIRLDPTETPITAREIFDLAASGFFDETGVHRVVPNFVVQGGDPRGDGWGGAGFIMPDEVSYRPFDAGRVGVATDGPNTGTGQLFVTLMPADHLTGHFTNIGEVVVGRELLARLRVGDRIREITALSGDEPPRPTPVLIGELDWSELSGLDGWAEERAGYEPDPASVEQLRTASERYSITTVLGTWCSDSKREVPRLVKVLEEVNGASFEHRMIGVDRTRRIDDEALASTAGVERTVERVATVVVFDADGLELGRVVETADAPLEQLLVEFIAPLEGWD